MVLKTRLVKEQKKKAGSQFNPVFDQFFLVFFY